MSYIQAQALEASRDSKLGVVSYCVVLYCIVSCRVVLYCVYVFWNPTRLLHAVSPTMTPSIIPSRPTLATAKRFFKFASRLYHSSCSSLWPLFLLRFLPLLFIPHSIALLAPHRYPTLTYILYPSFYLSFQSVRLSITGVNRAGSYSDSVLSVLLPPCAAVQT